MAKTRITIAQVRGFYDEEMTPQQRHETNFREFEARLAQAADERPDLILAGECINCIGCTPDAPAPTEKVFDGAFFSGARRAARETECYVCYGFKGQDDDGILRNAAVLVDRAGEVAGVYYKVHPTQVELNRGTIAGDSFPVFETDFGPVGVLICHDMSYPESARCLMLNGARLLLWPSNWSGWGEEISYTIITSRAIDNSVHLVYASMGQDPEQIRWLSGTKSRSAVFNPEGRMVAQITDRLPGVVSCQVDLSWRRIAPWFTTGESDPFLECVLRERRPDAYGPIVAPKKPAE